MRDVRELLQTRSFMFALMLAVVLLVANIIVQASFGDPRNWPASSPTLAPFAIVAMASTPSIVTGGGGWTSRSGR